MKIILVGASGTIGKGIYDELSKAHEVIQASRKGADIEVDITSSKTIEAMFEAVGEFDALISVAGGGYLGPLASTTEAHFLEGLHYKLQGQINLVLLGQLYIKEGGSFTLTSGILSEKPIPQGSNLSVVNAGIDAFVKAAAIDLQERNIRINAVSPALLEESFDAMGAYFPGHTTVPLRDVVPAYVKSVEGNHSGQVFKVF